MANGIVGQVSHFLPKLQTARENRKSQKDWSNVPTHRHDGTNVCANWCIGICRDGGTCRFVHLQPNQLPEEYTNKLVEVVTEGKTRAEEIIGRMTMGRNNNTNLGNRWQGRQQ